MPLVSYKISLKECYSFHLLSGNIIIWVGIVDQFEEGVWQDPSPPNPLLTFDGFWETGQPNGGTLENCVRTYIDRRWRDQSCDERSVIFLNSAPF